MHGLKLVVKEEALPLKEQPEFPALAELAKRGLLAPDTWNCKRAQISLKATIDVPMLGTIIEQNGDGLLKQSHMPAGCNSAMNFSGLPSALPAHDACRLVYRILTEPDVRRWLLDRSPSPKPQSTDTCTQKIPFDHWFISE